MGKGNSTLGIPDTGRTEGGLLRRPQPEQPDAPPLPTSGTPLSVSWPFPWPRLVDYASNLLRQALPLTQSKTLGYIPVTPPRQIPNTLVATKQEGGLCDRQWPPPSYSITLPPSTLTALSSVGCGFPAQVKRRWWPGTQILPSIKGPFASRAGPSPKPWLTPVDCSSSREERRWTISPSHLG